MTKNYIKRMKLVRTISAVLATIFTILLISTIVLSGTIDQRFHMSMQQKEEVFKELVASIEFNGVGDGLKNLAVTYSKLFPRRNVNVIVTDSSGKVLFNLNQGYMPDSGRFLVAVPVSNEGPYYHNAFIIDNNKEIRYMVGIENPGDTFKLREFTSQLGVELPEAHDGTYEVERSVNGVNKKIRIDFRGNFNNNSNMHYAYIGSKGLNLYTVFDNDFSFRHYNNDRLSAIRNIMGGITIMFLILFWLSLPIWVFMDASSRDFKAPLWSILTLATNIVGLLIYLTVRPEFKKCVNCEQALDKKFVVCPYCGTTNRNVCGNCKQVLDDSWAVCPYCGTRTEAAPEESEMDTAVVETGLDKGHFS